MGPRVNIPKTDDDPFARYYRETIDVALVKGFTYITNLPSIAKSLQREEKDIVAFFTKKLGTSTSNNNNLRGTFTVSQLDNLLETYIEKYVLCEQCHNPETVFNKKKVCKACGYTS